MSSVNMEQLVKVVNKLQDAFSSLSLPNAIELPQIVVIGRYETRKLEAMCNSQYIRFLARAAARAVSLKILLAGIFFQEARELSPEDPS